MRDNDTPHEVVNFIKDNYGNDDDWRVYNFNGSDDLGASNLFFKKGASIFNLSNIDIKIFTVAKEKVPSAILSTVFGDDDYQDNHPGEQSFTFK